MSDPKLNDEKGRLLALHRYGVLDSLREPNFDSITSIVRELIGVPICAVSLVDSDRQWFKSVQGLEATETPRRIAFCDHTIRSRQPLIVNDALQDERFCGNPMVLGEPFVRSYAGAPLTSPDGYNLGALCAIDRRVREFTSTDIALLERFAKIVVDQLELRNLAHRDFLTGALTRRAFTDAATAALHQIAGVKRSSTIAILDLDHFKRINDDHGHPVGDRALKTVSAIAGSELRESDLFGRMGGEEFAILFHGTELEDAFACAERVRLALAAHGDSGCPPVTASIGLAEIHCPTQLDLALAQADAALYAAKRAGRNRCMMATCGASKIAA